MVKLARDNKVEENTLVFKCHYAHVLPFTAFLVGLLSRSINKLLVEVAFCCWS